MKRVELKVIKIGDKDELSYRDHLISLIKSPLDPKNGVGIDELRKSVRLLDKIESAPETGFVDLEDADFQVLKEKIENGKFMRSTRELLQFLEDILNSEAVQS